MASAAAVTLQQSRAAFGIASDTHPGLGKRPLLRALASGSAAQQQEGGNGDG